MKPTECRQVFNSYSDLGTVVRAKKLTTIRENAGYRVGDGKTIDAFRLAGYLIGERTRREGQVASEESAAEKNRRRARERNRRVTREDQEISIGEVKNPDLLEEVTNDLRRFCEVCLPNRFYNGWSEDHLRVIAKAERAILKGGLFAVAMPRGQGKTAIVDAAALWAILCGHRRYIMLIGATEREADKRFDSLKMMLTGNKQIRELFPKVCQPIWATEGQKRKQIRIGGELVHMEMSSEQIVLPVVEGSKASGGVIQTRGITGAVRGANYTLPDGSMIRPDLVLIDDPQTSQSARSAMQCAERGRVIAGDVLGLAGPDVTISGLMPMTVIRPGDLADTILDSSKHPEWDSERCPLIYNWPENTELWEQYEEILKTSEGDRYERHERATEFYRNYRDEMDQGARVAWDDRYDKGKQLSALQYAYDWKIRDAEAFAAEAQQQPLADDRFALTLTADDIMGKINNRPRREVPFETQKLTTYIDVQMRGLFYVTIAWDANFSGSVVDYGTWPDQHASYFSRATMRFTMQQELPGSSLQAAIYHALEQLIEFLAGREWERESGGIQSMDRILIDANWGESTPTVYQFCRQSKYRSILTPSHGEGVGPNNRPMSEHEIKPTEKIGLEWKLVRNAKKRPIPYLLIDTNFWKTFAVSRWATLMGGRGCLSVFGEVPADHKMFADEQCSEYRVPTQGRGRKVDVWQIKPTNPDNDWWDCVVGCCVAASMEGVTLEGTQIRELVSENTEQRSMADMKNDARRNKRGR